MQWMQRLHTAALLDQVTPEDRSEKPVVMQLGSSGKALLEKVCKE